MMVIFIAEFTVPPEERHFQQLHDSAESLTDDRCSVKVLQPDPDLRELHASFSYPKARQMDVVDKIAHAFAWRVEDLSTCSMTFPRSSPKPRKTRRKIRRDPPSGIAHL